MDLWGIDYYEYWWKHLSSHDFDKLLRVLSHAAEVQRKWYIADSTQGPDKVEAVVVGMSVQDNPSYSQNEEEEEEKNESATIETLTLEEDNHEDETTDEQPAISESVKEPQVNKLIFGGEVDPFQNVGTYCDPFLLSSQVVEKKVNEKIGVDQPKGPKIEWSIFSKRQRYNSLGMTYIFPTTVFAPLSAAKIDKLWRSWRRDKST